MLTVIRVPALQDNYIWLVSYDKETYWVVDPGESQGVLQLMAQNNLKLGGIWVTHHHRDHTQGIPGLLAKYPSLPVLGPAQEIIPNMTQALQEGPLLLPGWPPIQVWSIPGHTAGHIAYLCDNTLFCGDTLFTGGCGRVFDGTIEQLWASLQRLRGLALNTLIYCAHEYTEKNLQFAMQVEPDNVTLQKRLQQVRKLREQKQATVPSLLADELATNPFLRTHVAQIQTQVQRYWGEQYHSEMAIFAALRAWKDIF